MGTNYRKRYNDDLSKILNGFNQTQFENDYANRTADTAWGGARLTGFAYELRETIIRMSVSEAHTPIPLESSLTINMYPYGIDKEAWTEVMCEFFEVSQITFISAPPESLTPRFIRGKFETVAMYDFDRWINIHVGELKKCAMPSVSFHAPCILKETDPVSIKLYEGGFAADSIREMLALKLSLKMEPLKQFSIIEL